MEKKKLISTLRTWHALYSTTVKWSSTAPRVAAELTVKVGQTRRGASKPYKQKTKQTNAYWLRHIVHSKHLVPTFGLGLVDEGQGLLPAVIIVVFVPIA